MSTTGQLLDKVKLYYPPASNFTDAQIVDVMNDVQREIFRELQEEAMYEFQTIAHQALYSMPSNMAIEFIKYVGVTSDTTITDSSCFQEYTYARPDEEMRYHKYFNGYNNLIGLYPVPSTTGYNVKIIYEERPTLLSENILAASPDLSEDWHRILVYGAIMELAGAGANPDIEIVNNYTIKYNQMMMDMSAPKYDGEPKYPKIKDVSKKVKVYSRRTPETVVFTDVT